MFRKEGLLGVAVGAAMALALGAISFLVKPGWAGLGQASPRADQATKRLPPAVRTLPATLPPDFDAQCRAAGL